MKKFLLIIISMMIFLIACSDDKNTKVIVTGVEPPPVEEPKPEPEDPPLDVILELAFWTGEQTKFYDGENVFTWNNGYSARAESQVYSKNNFLFFLDEFGNNVEIVMMPIVPEFVRLYYDESIDHQYIYTTESIDPETASESGAFPAWYTKVYQDDNELGNWQSNKYLLADLKVVDGNVYAKSTVGAWYHLNGDKQKIQHVDNELVIDNFESFEKHATINGVYVQWTYNWFGGSKHWFKYNDVFYSHNGYTFDGSTLKEDGSAMWDYRFKQNVIIPAGVYNGNFYYIQCATGYIIKYNPNTDTTSEPIRIYNGDGTNGEGIFFKTTLNPVTIDNYLYFIVDADYYRYNFETGITTLFVSGVSEIYEY